MTGASQRLIVEATDLDTDERSVATFDVEIPPDEDGRRKQLADVVADLHPAARMRSFAGAAASFLDSQQLVVAHYSKSGPHAETPADRIECVEQPPLFAV